MEKLRKVMDYVFILLSMGSIIGLFACYMFVPLHGKEMYFVAMFLSNFVIDYLIESAE